MSKKRKKSKKQKAPRSRRRSTAPKRRDIDLTDLLNIISRAKLPDEDRDQLRQAVDTLAFLTHELERSDVSIARLRKLIFGSSSEKTRDVLPDQTASGTSSDPETSASESQENTETQEDTDPRGSEGTESNSEADSDKKKKKKKGHGRLPAAAYTGAEKINVPHEHLCSGDECPTCGRGKVYQLPKPAVLVRVRGVAPLEARVYELERLRCNLCGEVFTSSSPPGVGEAKYDETAAAMIALLKYGCGLPFNRLERLGKNLGMPLPASTQWDVVAETADMIEPAWAELIRQAAGGDVLYLDDTNMVVLSLAKQIKAELAAGESKRTGIFTSGVLSTVEGRKLAVFFTGRKHAGENLNRVLAQRDSKLLPPILMCDALSRNTSPGEFETIVSNCLVHARRNFVDVVSGFPNEVTRVLKTLREVYKHEATTQANGLTSEQRLTYHQQHSKPLMTGLKGWLDGLIKDKEVEPNSGLGGAIKYLDNHWEKLTLFLRKAGAPLDNNICERMLKRAILHRKNSLFYRTENGARVGDMFQSLIHTAELCDANPFDYLVALQGHRAAVAAEPGEWMPWNYQEALAQQK